MEFVILPELMSDLWSGGLLTFRRLAFISEYIQLMPYTVVVSLKDLPTHCFPRLSLEWFHCRPPSCGVWYATTSGGKLKRNRISHSLHGLPVCLVLRACQKIVFHIASLLQLYFCIVEKNLAVTVLDSASCSQCNQYNA